jgi:hypothetical protein
LMSIFFFLRCDIPVVYCSQCTMVNVYSVMNTTIEGLLYQWYAIDNKLHVSTIIRFLTRFEEKKAS